MTDLNRYQLVTIYHAENDADATAQANKSLDAFDDGYERVVLREHFTMAPSRLVFIEAEDHKRVTP